MCGHKPNEYLLGAKIISTDDEFGGVDSIVVATADGRQFVISGEEYARDYPDIVIEEVAHPIKVEVPVHNTIEEYDTMFDAIEMIEPDIRKQVRAYCTATKLIKQIDKVLEKLGDN